MKVIPLQVVPSQTLTVNLGGQACRINIYQKLTGLYCDLYVNDVLIIGGVICENLNRIVRDAYLGFVGDLAFTDNLGLTDPTYKGFAAQYSFLYLELADMQALGLA